MRVLTYYGDHVAYISDEATMFDICRWLEDAVNEAEDDKLGPLNINEAYSIVASNYTPDTIVLSGDEDYFIIDLEQFNPVPVI